MTGIDENGQIICAQLPQTEPEPDCLQICEDLYQQAIAECNTPPTDKGCKDRAETNRKDCRGMALQGFRWLISTPVED